MTFLTQRIANSGRVSCFTESPTRPREDMRVCLVLRAMLAILPVSEKGQALDMSGAKTADHNDRPFASARSPLHLKAYRVWHDAQAQRQG